MICINNDTIVEVKPLYLINTKKIQEKKNACIKQFPEYEYKFMTENDINIDNKKIINDYNNGTVIIDKGKLNKFKKIYKI